VRAEPAVLIPLALAVFAVGFAGGGFGEVSLGVATVGVWAVLAGLLASGRLDFRGMTPFLWLGVGALAVLAGFQALSIEWASDDGAAFADLTRTLLYLGIVGLVGLAAKPGSAPSWLAGLAVGGAAIALVAVASRTFGFGSDADLASELPLAAERLSYPLGYWNGLGYLMAMTLITLCWFAVAGRPRQSELALAATVPVVVVVFLTGSRGAAIAAILGLAVVVWMLPARTRVFTAAAIAIPAWTIAIVAFAATRDRLDPAGDPGLSGIAMAIGVMGLAIGAALVLRFLTARRLRPHFGRRIGTLLAVASTLAILTAAAVFGVESFTGSFRGEAEGGSSGVAAGLASSSDRVEFWQTALQAFADDPLRGTGAGGFPLYWNQNAEISVIVRNAHSAPIEELGELGLIGGLSIIALLLAPAIALRSSLRGVGPGTRAMIGPIAGVLIVGTIAVAVDWTWDMPGALAPYLVCLALATGTAVQPRTLRRGSLLTDAGFGGYERDPRPAHPSPAICGGLAAVAAAVAIWAGGVVALAGVQLDRSEDFLAEGRLVEAAEAARAAQAIEPWSPEPALRLAEIEVVGGNLDAGRRRAEEAARASPEDFRPWVLLSEIQVKLGNLFAINPYGTRLRALSPDLIEQRGFNARASTRPADGYSGPQMAGVTIIRGPAQ
jgi:O-antigen ligase